MNSDRSVLIVCLSEVVTRQVSGKEVMKSRLILVFFSLFLESFAGCHTSSDPESQGQNSNAEPTTKHTIVATSPGVQDVTTYRDFVCLIHSRRHIEVHALESGYLTSIEVTEGQSVKQGDVMFRILAALKKASLDAVIAEAKTTEIEFANTKKLADQKIVSVQEVNLAQAKLDNAKAKVDLARTELGLTDVKAAFDGMVDRQDAQQGSLISEGDLLTTLSDNTVMWVYFNVPEARYLEYRETPDFDKDMVLELVLANHKKFGELGKIGAIETDFNNKTGNISFRGDFSNPQNILRHGQTGTIRIPHHLKNTLVIPQRATYNILDRRYVYAIEDNVVKQREITVAEELEDIFVIAKGLSKDDKFVLDGVRQVRDGDKITYEFKKPEEVLATLKNKAE